MKKRVSILFPDLHLGSHDLRALRCALKIAEHYKASRAVILGDWLDAHSASAHPATDRREAKAASYLWELEACGKVLDYIEGLPSLRETVYIEGNHEYRVERWALSAGKIAREIVDTVLPETVLSEGRGKKFTWVPYKSSGVTGCLELAEGLIGCHGWSTAKHAASVHLARSHGLSVVHGHTHRSQMYRVRHPITGRSIEAHSFGCLAKLQPLWVSGPTDWAHGVGILQERGDRWAIHHIQIVNGRAILPDGALIDAGRKDSLIPGVA